MLRIVRISLISALGLVLGACATNWVHSQKPPAEFAADREVCQRQALDQYPPDIQTVARPLYGLEFYAPYGYANSAHFLFRAPFGSTGCVPVKDGSGRFVCRRSPFFSPGFHAPFGSNLGVVAYEQTDLNARDRQRMTERCLMEKGWRQDG